MLLSRSTSFSSRVKHRTQLTIQPILNRICRVHPTFRPPHLHRIQRKHRNSPSVPNKSISQIPPRSNTGNDSCIGLASNTVYHKDNKRHKDPQAVQEMLCNGRSVKFSGKLLVGEEMADAY